MEKKVADKVARLERQKEEALKKAKAADALLREIRAEQDRKAKIAERKARTVALIQTGALVEIAGLLSMDKGTLLGGLQEIAKIIESDPEKSHQWKSAGDAELAQREAEKKKSKPSTPT
ncbi:MAG: conjugal transfer protein TraD [Acidithiobacillus sp.]|uniref:conjugal transfer protein TraD n=1 Tax=Acidithiobacillus sp. TaxID=1872118 RepID=UPI0025879CE8|nr:conjugal transfer protein TraD [Acidithiobacillus sp.]MCE5421155.1 conjugal transfer protein TraD [Acidithiobacillus sp.]